jgi:hypothetical protein
MLKASTVEAHAILAVEQGPAERHRHGEREHEQER